MDGSDEQNQRSVEQFKIKRLIKKLIESKGNGTSMVSIIVPPKKNLNEITRLLNSEQSKCENIKDRINRQSVQDAMVSAKERLKLVPKTPPNGLVLYVGKILEADGRTEKKLVICFEPYRPLNTSLYFCDSKFHVDELRGLLDNEAPFGFIIVDGNGALFATVQGNTKDILHKFSVELPKKHHKGGQSSVRFARLRMEKRHNYLRKVCETATSMFIANDKCSVNALILAGSADFKNDMEKSQMFDPRLLTKVVKVVDVSYGGVNGLNQAIELSQEAMTGFKYVQEKKLISGFFSDISQDTGKVVYGIAETMAQLEAGTLEQIICWENLNVIRLVLKNKETDSLSTQYVDPEKVDDQSLYKDRRTGEELEMVSDEPLNEWLVENYMKFGAQLQLITDKSSEGFQFVKGFQGIGGFLRFKLEQEHFMPVNKDYEDEDDFI